MKDRLRIVVAGLAATYPLGGVFWDYLQYVGGLQRLGHTVMYVEDTEQWCYDPAAATFVEDGSWNAGYFASATRPILPALPWFIRDARGATYGSSWAETAEFCRTADLFIHISASPLCTMREEYLQADRIIFIDTDPMYTHAALEEAMRGPLSAAQQQRLALLGSPRSVCFTFAENIGRSDCAVPAAAVRWMPTRQPIVLEWFQDAAVKPCDRRRTCTTVASWRRNEDTPSVNGVTYAGKSHEFDRFMDLPSRVQVPLELAVSGGAPVDVLQEHGWRVRPAYDVSADPFRYRQYLATSCAEWSVAKQAYVKSRSGWFSCRTACYLALGVPAIVQDTGFSKTMTVGEGLIAFDDPAGAAEGINEVVAAPERHSKAAYAIAEEYFHSDKVLTRLIDEAFTGKQTRAA